MAWIEVYGGQRSLFSFQANHRYIIYEPFQIETAFPN